MEDHDVDAFRQTLRKQFPVNLLDFSDRDYLQRIPFEIKPLGIVPGYEYTTEAQLVGFGDPLFHPVDGTDLAT